MTMHHRLFALVSAMAFLSTSSASAGPDYTITTTAANGGSQLESLTWTFNGKSETGLAGTLLTSITPGGTQYSTYCIDLYHDFKIGSSWTAQVLPISSYVGESGIPTGDNAGGHAGAIGYLYNTYAASVATAIQGAALQIAIWKVDYDNTNSFSTGSFQFAPTSNATSIQSQVFAQATAYLAGFNGTQTSSNASYLMATSHPQDTNQDFVGPQSLSNSNPNVVVNSVPEPSSLILVAMGMGAFVVKARRRRNA